LLASTMWCALSGGAETGSTNDDAREIARRGAPEGSVVLASRQLSGRGRLGRSWASPEGGVYLSAVLRPIVAPVRAASLALAIALGVALGVERLGARPGLKWPNDVLLDGGKLAGVLLEMSAEADSVDWVVAGVGLNVRAARGRSLEPGAAYLEDAIGPVRLARVAAAELDGIAAAYGAWRAGAFAAIRGEYERRQALVGETVRVSDLTGAVHAEGVAEGVDEEGRLLVRAGTGQQIAVVAGEVTLRD